VEWAEESGRLRSGIQPKPVQIWPKYASMTSSAFMPVSTRLEIMVPLFIASGEKIRVYTSERKYAWRESEEKK
jgi:hypothetical protein